MERIAFFGTPEFALPCLQALCEADRTPVAVITQPARPRGRGRRLAQPAVARWALARGLEVLQPESVRQPDFLSLTAGLELDTAVVVAFGQIFPGELLGLPRRGCLNVHASLLPRYRGAAPVQAAIMAGDRVTGVTTMLMDEGMDTGPILLQREVAIGAEETAGELSQRLSRLGADLLLETLEGWEAGSLEPRPQDHARATIARRLTRDDGVLDWSGSAGDLFNRLRGLTPWPGVSTLLRGESIKILWGRPVDCPQSAPVEPGTCLGLIDGRLVVACGGATTFGIERLQRPGRKPLQAGVFVRGEHLAAGELLG